MRLYTLDGKCNISGERIKSAHAKAKLTQDQLAARLQVAGLQMGQMAISRIESGKRLVSDFELPIIAEALNVSTDWLLGIEKGWPLPFEVIILFYILNKYGLRPIRFHDLRHSCATIMLYLGYSLKDIQTWLGHSNYNFTADTYIHSGMGAHEQIVLSMSEWLGELLPQNIAPDLTAIWVQKTAPEIKMILGADILLAFAVFLCPKTAFCRNGLEKC